MGQGFKIKYIWGLFKLGCTMIAQGIRVLYNMGVQIKAGKINGTKNGKASTMAQPRGFDDTLGEGGRGGTERIGLVDIETNSQDQVRGSLNCTKKKSKSALNKKSYCSAKRESLWPKKKIRGLVQKSSFHHEG